MASVTSHVTASAAPLSSFALAAAAVAYDAACMRLAGLFPVMLAFLLGTAAGTIAYVGIGSWGLLVPVALMYGAFGWASAWPGAD